jgi:hypothetical protein
MVCQEQCRVKSADLAALCGVLPLGLVVCVALCFIGLGSRVCVVCDDSDGWEKMWASGWAASRV